MSCKVCGEPKLVKSHIFPRALMHDIRGKDTAMFAADREKARWKEYQSGPWDSSILCAFCEASLNTCDDYAIKWIREFEKSAKPLPDGLAFEVSNPKPDLLVKFVAATLWRAAVAPHVANRGLNLGPWEYALRKFVFETTNKEPRVFVARKIWTVEGERIPEIAVPPHDAPNWGKRAFNFDLAGFQWAIRLDGRFSPKSPFHSDLLCNGRKMIMVLNMGTKEIFDDQEMMDIFDAADKGTRRS